MSKLGRIQFVVGLTVLYYLVHSLLSISVYFLLSVYVLENAPNLIGLVDTFLLGLIGLILIFLFKGQNSFSRPELMPLTFMNLITILFLIVMFTFAMDPLHRWRNILEVIPLPELTVLKEDDKIGFRLSLIHI